MWKRRNEHFWSETNPRFSQETGHQTRWSVKVWGGVYKNLTLGPIFFLLSRMAGVSYLHFINNELLDILDDIPLADYPRVWFQQDGAPPHVSRPVRQRLGELFGDRWIRRMGPHA
ncbi:unnamed protein product [Leptosia nina]|uniref:Transposase n=1 Tax=Leptosia nina TaxID=320188 RepID=A0AAV1JZZ6_9NEOP